MPQIGPESQSLYVIIVMNFGTSVHGGGSPEAERKAIFRSYDLESRKAMAKRAAGIEV